MAKLDKRLKKILVKTGYLEDRVADEAFEESLRDEEKSLTDILIERRLLDERTIVAAVAREMKLPPIDVNNVQVEDRVLETMPRDLAQHYLVLPISRLGDQLTLAVANPFDILKLDDLRIVTGCEIRPVVSTERSIHNALVRVYDKSGEQLEAMYQEMVDPSIEMANEIEDEFDLADVAAAEREGSPVIKMVNLIIYQAIKDRVSDIHIEPMEKRMRIRYRKDGVLYEKPAPHKGFQNGILSRIKIMSKLDIAERRVPQDGKFKLKVEGRPIDFRVSVLPTIHGEKVVMRVLDSASLKLSLEQLGFEEKALTDFKEALAAPYGMVLVTGPTGSGKTTTLYSALREMLSTEDNVITVEDPVEYQLEGVTQVAVNPKVGLTFSRSLRSILRQDPDKIMIGEIRDLETMEIAVKAALTGHLVLSTLHTNDAASTVTRMVDMGLEPFMVASSCLLVSAQRLMRRLCGHCKEPTTYPADYLKKMGLQPQELKDATLFKAIGCARCMGGYNGRFAVLETLPVSSKIQEQILRGGNDLEIKRSAMEHDNMITLRRCALLNAMRGHTSLEEVGRMTLSDDR